MRKYYLFRGSVQGVGFRYTSQKIAVECGLQGWIKNLSDGTVEAVLDGDEVSIQEFMEELKDYFGDGISDYLEQEILMQEEFKGFEIRY